MSLIDDPGDLLLQEYNAHTVTKNDLARAKDDLDRTKNDLAEAQKLNKQLEAKVKSLQGEKNWLTRKMMGPAAPSASSSEISALRIQALENQVAHFRQAASPAAYSGAIERDHALLKKENAILENTKDKLVDQIDRLKTTISDQKKKHTDEQRTLTKELKAVQMQLATHHPQPPQEQPTNHYSWHFTQNITMAPPVMPVAQHPIYTASQAADSLRTLAIEDVTDTPMIDVAMPLYRGRCRNETSRSPCAVPQCPWVHQEQVDNFSPSVIAALPANSNDARIRLRFGEL
ncbi:hypothetical protein BDU57DRAFT_298463 [Ampelomyces quisqualis]|uniref:Uncharacterized protein n=1 Tax=Ampelomyces quisqualis TaxID=50730 RepID=A0A6A5QIR0_AMPQU|nr:hypothetical protein BDU57DRAFT_298463 [Ampelomyces quisqualis]